jgi:hypothetical protein
MFAVSNFNHPVSLDSPTPEPNRRLQPLEWFMLEIAAR